MSMLILIIYGYIDSDNRRLSESEKKYFKKKLSYTMLIITFLGITVAMLQKQIAIYIMFGVIIAGVSQIMAKNVKNE